MTLDDALQKLALSEAKQTQMIAENAQLTAEKEAAVARADSTENELRDTQAKLSEADKQLRIKVAQQAIGDTLNAVNFIGDEARDDVGKKLFASLKWTDDGTIDADALKESAKPYTDGTSVYVVATPDNTATPAAESWNYPPLPSAQQGKPVGNAVDMAALLEATAEFKF